MLNKLKYLFLLTICAGLIGSSTNISAQTGGTSVKASDVNKVIEFFEWAFETKFTAVQRSSYQEMKAEAYRKDPSGEQKAMNDLIANLNAVRAKSENEQARIRQAFVPDFVGKLREAGDDQEARLLASVYDGAQAQNDQGAEAAGSGDLSSLVGKWAWAHTGGSTIGTNGVYLGSNGSRFTYQFSPNGSVEFTGMMNVMQGGCSQQIFRSIRGQASLSGMELTIRWAPEKFTRDFSCDTAHNYTKTMPAKTETQKIEFKNDLGQRQLCFVGAECFSPTNK